MRASQNSPQFELPKVGLALVSLTIQNSPQFDSGFLGQNSPQFDSGLPWPEQPQFDTGLEATQHSQPNHYAAGKQTFGTQLSVSKKCRFLSVVSRCNLLRCCDVWVVEGVLIGIFSWEQPRVQSETPWYFRSICAIPLGVLRKDTLRGGGLNRRSGRL